MAVSLSDSPPSQGPICPVCFRDYSDSEAELIPRILQCGHTYCTPFCRDNQLRLVGGTNDREGRVEVCFNETWGTVCDDAWDDMDANVVCSGLGFSRFNNTALLHAHFGPGTGPIYLDNLACVGSEPALTNCTHDTHTADCTHSEDASVQCNGIRICENGDIRLVGGTTEFEGRVEICWNEVWGTVCDDFWSTFDAIVACRQLGFSPTGAVPFSFARFGQGTGPIYLDDLLCNSRETRLIDCPNRGIGVHNCAHFEDAGLRCLPGCTAGAIRLAGFGSNSSQGRVEVCMNNQWGTVCDDFWDANDANVACRQLGFSRYNATAVLRAGFGAGSGPIYLDDVRCDGSEIGLVNCTYDSVTTDCSHTEDAGVRCSLIRLCNDGDVRLVAANGSTVGVSSGRVEVCFDETWGTVSDDQWAATAAGVVCSQVGFSRFNAQPRSNAAFGQGTGPIFLNNVVCGTTQNRLINCTFDMNTAGRTHADDAGVICSTTRVCNDGNVRLEDGTVEEEGRVEVCMNEAWGTVCDDSWAAVDANVVCGQLGYSRYNAIAYQTAQFGQGTGPIFLDDVGCVGNESRLVDCRFTANHNCDHSEDAGAGCNRTYVCNNGDIRLMGGSTMYEGRVELCWNETWGTICDGFWSTNDANVACRQLGFLDTGATAYSNAYFGHGTGPILLDDLVCNGQEARLIDCPRVTSQGIGTYDFCPNGHGEDAGVGCPEPCADGGIRLVGGTLPNEGRVEVCLNNRWGTVCDDAWGAVDASVACRQLGYSAHNATAYSFARYGQGTGPIHMDNVACTGTENALLSCPYDSDSSDCFHFEDASVLCQFCSNGDIRLVGGSTPNEGRVEVCQNAAWGTVCDDSWDNTDAAVACRQLGFSGANATALPNAAFGQGSGAIVLDNVACTGSEGSLVNCPYDPHTADCFHSQDASVRCSIAAPVCQHGDVRLVGPTNYTGRVEVCVRETWSTVCDNMWSAMDASVVCRQLGYSRFNATAQSGAAFGQGSGSIALNNVGCTGNETRLVDCTFSSNVAACTHSNDASATCVPNLLCQNGDIRLVNGTTFYEGRVEICWNETWGTVCDGFWSTFDATVACRQLGFISVGATPLYNAFFGQGTGPILLDDLICDSTESRLVDCQHDGIGNFDFCRGHLDDAGLRCAESCVGDGIRLVGGTTSYEGRVEICKGGSWGTVCDDLWNAPDAQVACRQLGFSGTNAIAYSLAAFGQGAGPIHLDDVQCAGTESRLTDCVFTSTHNCIHFEDAGVRCQQQRICNNGDLRLNGTTPGVTSQGRVELCWNETWGTICDGFWSTNDGNVACRQLGFSRYGAVVYPNAFFGMGTGRILLNDVRCAGSETRLVDCPSGGVGNSDNCRGHTDDAGVQCQPLLCRDGQIRLAGGSTPYEGRVEICQNEQWGTICDSPWDDNAATVVCNQLGYSVQNARAVSQAQFGPGSGPTIYSNVRCNGNESSIMNCSYTSGGACTDAGVICQRRRSYPSAITITAASRYVNITWQPPTEVYSTIVKYSINCTGRGSSVIGETRDNTSRSFILQELRPYTDYTCCVMTVTVVPGGSAECVTATTLEDVPTGRATRLQGLALNATAAQLSWQPPPSDELNGALRFYTVTLREAQTGQIVVYNTTTPNITVGSLMPCTSYSWDVRAYTIGYGPPPLQFYSVNTLPIVNAPGYQVTVNVVVQSDDQIFVVWNTPSSVQNQGLVYFDVTVQSLSTANQYYREQRQYYVQGQTTSNTLTFSGLVEGVLYQVNLTALICQNIVLVDSRTIYTREGVPTVGPSVTSVVRTSTTTATLNLTALGHETARGNVTGYSVRYRPKTSQDERCSASDANTWTATPNTTSSTTFDLMGLDPSVAYCVAVAATTMRGTGPYGTPVTIAITTSATFQITLSGVTPNCRTWITVRSDDKMAALTEQLANSLSVICSCVITSGNIGGGSWICDDNNPITVTFRANVISVNSETIASDVTQWATQNNNVNVGTETLQVVSGERCTNTDCVTQAPTGAPSLWILAVIAVLIVILIIVAVLVVIVLIWRRSQSGKPIVNSRLASEGQIGIVENPLYVDEDEALESPTYPAAAPEAEEKTEGAINAVSFDFGQSKPE